MGRHLIRGFIEAFGTLLCIIFITFFILRILPGGPFEEESSLNPVIQQEFEKSWGLHEPVIVQFLKYSNSIIHGDLGLSMAEPGRSVTSLLSEGLMMSLGLNFLALLFVFIFGFMLSALVVISEKYWIKELADIYLSIMISLPSLFLGPLLIYIFCYHLDWLPSVQLKGPTSYILPILALALRPSAYLARVLIKNWSDEILKDYMRMALAKGLSHKQALFRHALKNSLVPVLNYSSPLILHLISGSFLVELLFSIQGMGTLFVKALGQRDYPVVMGFTLFLGILSILIQWSIDILNRQLDPRWSK